jgi:hypothetical protein
VLDFKAVLDKQGVPAEMMRGTVPLDMSQYSKLFTTARYPQQDEDYVMRLFPSSHFRTSRTLSFPVLCLTMRPYRLPLSSRSPTSSY